MSNCIGKGTCDTHKDVVWAVPARPLIGGDVYDQTPSELVASGLWSQCIELQSAEPNTLRIRNFLLYATGAAAVGELSLLLTSSEAEAASPSADKSKPKGGVGIAPYVVGGIGAAAGAWAFLEHHRLSSDRMAFTQLRCREVLDRVNVSLVPKMGGVRFEDIECAGARVLTEGCTPVRRSASTTEWSTEPVSPAAVALVVGGVVLAAVAWEVVVPWMIASTPASPLVPAAALAL